MDKLSVVFLSPGWPGGKVPNGIVSYVSTLCAALQTRGHDVHVLSTLPPVEMTEPFVATLPTKDDRSLVEKIADKFSYKSDPVGTTSRITARKIVNRINAWHQQAKVDVVEVEESFGWSSYLAKHLDIPVVVRLHGPWFLNGPALGVSVNDPSLIRRDELERQGVLAAAGVTSCSADALAQSRGQWNTSLPGAQVIPNPVAPVPEGDRWNIAASEPGLILFVGRFDRHKGGDVMLDAFNLLARTHTTARLIFVGPDRGLTQVDGTTVQFKQYFETAVDAQIRPRVEYLGLQPHEAIKALRRRASVVVCCSRYENLPMAAMEALAIGCPLVVTRTGGLPELVQDGSTGLICTPDDPKDLADKLKRLIDSPDLQVRFGAAAAIDASTRFSPDAVAMNTLDFYRQTIERWTKQGGRG